MLYSFGRHERSALKTEFILGLQRFSKHDRTRVNGVSKSFVALILFLVLSLEKETAQKINYVCTIVNKIERALASKTM